MVERSRTKSDPTSKSRRRQTLVGPSPADVLDRYDPGDETQRNFRYQHAYGVILLVASITKQKPYAAIWCEHHEDYLGEREDGFYDAYQIKTRKPELGEWELNNNPLRDSIKRFVALNLKFPGRVHDFYFVSNVKYSASKAASRINKSPIHFLEAVRVATFDDGAAWLPVHFQSSFDELLKHCQCSSAELVDVLKRLKLVVGPGRDSFNDEIAHSHLPGVPGCESLASPILNTIRDELVYTIYKASSLQVEDPARHWSCVGSDATLDPTILAKRITVSSARALIAERSQKTRHAEAEHTTSEIQELAKVIRNDGGDDEELRQIRQLLEADRPHTERWRVEEAGSIASLLLPKMTAVVQRAQDGLTLIKAQTVIDSVGRLIERDERLIVLLPERAELMDALGRFDDSLNDLQRYVKSPVGIIDSGVLLKIGVLLMSLGNWGVSRRVLRITQRVAGERRQQVMARFFELWIDDYQRSRQHVIRECLALLSEAAELDDPALASMIEHRLGRTMFAASLESSNSGLMEESLRRFKSAKRRDEQATSFAPPYHDMWIARAAEALVTRDRSIRFEQAREAAEEIGGGWVAHVDLSEAHSAMRLGNWFKAKLLLLDAMKRWKPLPYPKGIFDVSYMLGQVCKELDEREDALTYLWLAFRLGSRLKLPLLNDARELFEIVARTRGDSREYAITRAEENLAAQSFSRILKGWSFTLPKWKLKGSEILPVAKAFAQDK